MARSSSEGVSSAVVLLDRIALVGLAIGMTLYVLPFWEESRLRWAFWLTLFSTVLHVYTSHRRGSAES